MEYTARPSRRRLATEADGVATPPACRELRPYEVGRPVGDGIAELPPSPVSLSGDGMTPVPQHYPLYVAAQPRRERRQPRALLAACAMVLLLVGLVSVGLGRGFTAALNQAGGVVADNPAASAAATGADRGAVGAIVEQAKPSPTTPAIVPTQAVPAPTAASPTLAMRYRQVTAAEATLQTGEFVSTVDYGNGTVNTSIVRFDLGVGGQPLQIALRSEYRAKTGTRVTERVSAGRTMWERRPGAGWQSAPMQQDPRGEVAALLPQLALVPESAVSGADGVLRWYDTRRAAAMTLTYDPQSGMPMSLRQQSETTGLVVSTIYRGWNAPVDIVAP